MLKLLFLLLATFTTNTTFASDDEGYDRYMDHRTPDECLAEAMQYEKKGLYDKAAESYQDAANKFKKANKKQSSFRSLTKAAECWRKANDHEKADHCLVLAVFEDEKKISLYEKSGAPCDAADICMSRARSCNKADYYGYAESYSERAATNYEELAKIFTKKGDPEKINDTLYCYRMAIMAWQAAGKPEKVQECRAMAIKYCVTMAIELVKKQHYAEAGHCYKEAGLFCKEAGKPNKALSFLVKAKETFEIGANNLISLAVCQRGAALCCKEISCLVKDYSNDFNVVEQNTENIYQEEALKFFKNAAKSYEQEAFELLKKQSFFGAAECYRMAAECWEELDKPARENVWLVLQQSFYQKLREAHNRKQEYVVVYTIRALFSWGSADKKIADKKTYWQEAARAYDQVARFADNSPEDFKRYQDNAKILRGLCKD